MRGAGRKGFPVTREPMPASEAELRRFACDFSIPGEFMPMFVIGKPLATLARGAVASVRLIDGKLAVLFDNQPAFRLERISSDTFGISGLPPGMTFQFKEEQQHRPRSGARHERPAEGPLRGQAGQIPGAVYWMSAGCRCRW